MRYTHEFSLGVKFRLIEISSMANSSEEKGCEFIYEIIDYPRVFNVTMFTNIVFDVAGSGENIL